MTEEDNGGIINVGKTSGGRYSGCSVAEERHEYRMFRTIILIGRVPENMTLLQTAHGAANILAIEHIRVVSDSAIIHGRLEQEILVRPVGDVHFVKQVKQEATELQRGEVGTQQQHTLTPFDSNIEIFQAGYSNAFSEFLRVAVPGNGGLD